MARAGDQAALCGSNTSAPGIAVLGPIPPLTNTRPSRSRTAACPKRAAPSVPAVTHWRFVGLYISAVLSGPDRSDPPTTRTRLFVRAVAVGDIRAWDMRGAA